MIRWLPKRRTGAACLAVLSLGLVALTGCRATSGLDRQEVIVAFQPTATQADHTRVWNACKNLPGVQPEPLDTTSKLPSVLLNNVRFRVDHATNLQIQQLENCVGKDPSVTGVRTDGSDDEQ